MRDYVKKFIFFLLLALVFLPQNLFGVKQFLIIANGEWDETLVRRYMAHRTVIGLDGVARKCYESSIVPHYILGDFDSIKEDLVLEKGDFFGLQETLAYFKPIPTPPDEVVKFESYLTKGLLPDSTEFQVTYIRANSQNYTDLDKGVKFCLLQPRQEKEPVDIVVACALGGKRIDHFLGNFSVLKKYRSPLVRIRFIDSLQTIQCLAEDDEALSISGPVEAKVGVFGFPTAIVRSVGLKWELNEAFPLEIGTQESSCNELLIPSAKITVEKGVALVMTPTMIE